MRTGPGGEGDAHGRLRADVAGRRRALGIEFHYRDNGNRIEQRISLPVWEHRVVVESPPARMAELMGWPELREFMRNQPGRPTTPQTTCTIHVDGRKVAEHTGTAAHCQVLVGQ
ncbi:hypothetical protein [Polymorphospora rubra]|uniref:hypothetical protein n=1 Tax=Polymorphospora rubra TaxID=338584 RepID=UPI001BB313DE|nr:hypothetical protein [Polymorphospora rubra]